MTLVLVDAGANKKRMANMNSAEKKRVSRMRSYRLFKGRKVKHFLLPVAVLIFVGVIASLVCRNRQADISGISPTITQTDKLSWRVDFAGSTWVDVNCYLFSPLGFLEEYFKARVAIRDESLAWASKLQYTAPTEDFRKSYREEVQMLEEGPWPWRDFDSWPNWPIVVVKPIITGNAAPIKVLVICRYTRKDIDVLFTMYCPDEEITFASFLKVAKQLTAQLETLNDEEWSQLPVHEALFDANDEITLREVAEFVGHEVFPKQH